MSGIACFGGKVKTQITFGAAGTGADTVGAGSISVPYPAGITAGMILILHIATKDTTWGVTTPAGWTLIASTAGGVVSGAACFWKQANGTESGSQAVTVNDGTYASGRMYRFSVGSGIEGGGQSRTAAAGTTFTNVDQTSTQTLEMAVQLESFTGATTVANSTGESGADYTQPVAVYTGSGNAGNAIQTATMAAAGAITGGTATIGASVPDRCVLSFFVLP